MNFSSYSLYCWTEDWKNSSVYRSTEDKRYFLISLSNNGRPGRLRNIPHLYILNLGKFYGYSKQHLYTQIDSKCQLEV